MPPTRRRPLQRADRGVASNTARRALEHRSHATCPSRLQPVRRELNGRWVAQTSATRRVRRRLRRPGLSKEPAERRARLPTSMTRFIACRSSERALSTSSGCERIVDQSKTCSRARASRKSKTVWRQAGCTVCERRPAMSKWNVAADRSSRLHKSPAGRIIEQRPRRIAVAPHDIDLGGVPAQKSLRNAWRRAPLRMSKITTMGSLASAGRSLRSPRGRCRPDKQVVHRHAQLAAATRARCHRRVTNRKTRALVRHRDLQPRHSASLRLARDSPLVRRCDAVGAVLVVDSQLGSQKLGREGDFRCAIASPMT